MQGTCLIRNHTLCFQVRIYWKIMMLFQWKEKTVHQIPPWILQGIKILFSQGSYHLWQLQVAEVGA